MKLPHMRTKTLTVLAVEQQMYFFVWNARHTFMVRWPVGGFTAITPKNSAN